MKKRYVIWLIVFSLGFIFAQKSEVKDDFVSLFQQANKSYTQQKFKTAIKLYSQILDLGINNGEILYNLGNAYYKTGKMIEAKYSYERARLFIPQDKDLQENLKLVNNNFTDKVEDDRAYGLKLIDYLKDSISLNTILWIYTGFLCFGSILIYIYLRRVPMPVILFIIYLSMFILFASITYSRVFYFIHPDIALIFQDRVEVKSGPDNRLATLFILHQGARVKLLSIDKDWVNIKYNNSLNGWIEKRMITVIFAPNHHIGDD
ncbi:MAG: hypothetical protein A2Y40_07440 [Candidatus Margulisbacteria bacterium GWF2_35_9]|nr:MAG: hypothetical protein A2Y40_07440 [Candidatus Margulisbacteria bacterium GWF2_35_9]